MYNPGVQSVNISGSSSQQNTNPPMSFINPFNIDNFLGLRLCLPFVRTLPSKKSQPQRRSRKKDTKRGRFEMKRKRWIPWTTEEKWHCAKARKKLNVTSGRQTYDMVNGKWKTSRPKSTDHLTGVHLERMIEMKRAIKAR
ncbi:hypothetical protein Tco_1201462 [Tanacetum coccineum]